MKPFLLKGRGQKQAHKARQRRLNGWMPGFAAWTLPTHLRPLPKKKARKG